jgi:hypothetical protein
VRVLSRLFRRLVLEQLTAAHAAGQLAFFGDHAGLADPQAFKRYLAPLREQDWVVYAKRPFAGPEAVLAYLARYTHRIAIANSRLLRFDEAGVTFRRKDYRLEGRTRHKTMTLPAAEFIRRFLLHILPAGFHRIRHYGFLANARRVANVAQACTLIAEPQPSAVTDTDPTTSEPPRASPPPCPHCGGIMAVIETFLPGTHPRAPPSGYAAVAIASLTATEVTQSDPLRPALPSQPAERTRPPTAGTASQDGDRTDPATRCSRSRPPHSRGTIAPRR